MGQFGMNLNQFLAQARQLLSPSRPGTERPGMHPGGMPLSQSSGPSGPGMNRMSMGALFANESMRLNPREMSQFLKDALKLPQEMKMFLMLMALEASPAEVKDTMKQNLRQIIQQNLNQLNVPLEDVQKLLGNSTKEATDKLMKLLQMNSISQSRGAAQVAELASTLTRMGEQIRESPARAMETLVMLYLPWHPLVANQQVYIDYSSGGGEAEEEGFAKESSMVLYLQTNTLGRFKLIVTQHDPLQLMVRVCHEKVAESLIPKLETQLNDILAGDGLPAALFDSEVLADVETLKQPSVPAEKSPEPSPDEAPSGQGFKDATRQADQKEISVQQGKQISLLVLSNAYALAKLIFEADEQNRTLQKKR